VRNAALQVARLRALISPDVVKTLDWVEVVVRMHHWRHLHQWFETCLVGQHAFWGGHCGEDCFQKELREKLRPEFKKVGGQQAEGQTPVLRASSHARHVGFLQMCQV
jgi:hypothetical protein